MAQGALMSHAGRTGAGGGGRTGLAISAVRTGNPAKAGPSPVAHTGATGLNLKELPGLVCSACNTSVTSGWK